MGEEADRSRPRLDALLEAASSGVVGGLTAMYVWAVFAVPGVVAAAAAAVAGVVVHLLPTPWDRA